MSEVRKKSLPIAGYTDYPIAELGDKPRAMAKIRPVRLLSYDGNKYAEVEVFDDSGHGIPWDL